MPCCTALLCCCGVVLPVANCSCVSIAVPCLRQPLVLPAGLPACLRLTFFLPRGGALPIAHSPQVERLADIPVPALSFEGAPTEGELSPVEEKARLLSLHAHKLVKDNK